MACIDEEIPKFKHYCRVCKKGFMCGRALGGHMRAHGIGDVENGIFNDEDDDDDNDSSDSEEKYGGSDFGTGIKRMYKLRTNPNRLKSCRNCEHCGKEFFSWKSFLEHGKCISDDTSESLVSSPSQSAGEYYGGRQVGGWSKRKRSFRANVGSFNSTSLSSEEEDLHLARCLIQLANTRVDLSVAAELEESCASASREEMEERRNLRILFGTTTSKPHSDNKAKGQITPKGFFECTTCKKVFNSHQALGGHRASHKKVKGCYAAKLEQQQLDETSLADDNVITHEDFLTSSKYYQYEQPPTLVGAAKRKSKVHECSICHKVFSSGQALGGHKRCHWITSNSPETSSLAKFQFQDKNTYQSIQTRPKTNIRQSDTLDLNSFPPWTEDMSRIKRDPHNPLSFEVSTDMHLHTWTGRDSSPPRESVENNIINLDSDMKNVENDETDNALKYAAKLSNLKDLKDDKDNSSQWLQVGIGSTAEASADI